ncbi:MAG: hypothetical protein ACNA8W_25080, partial [Bradymonadaceae bacterium]
MISLRLFSTMLALILSSAFFTGLAMAQEVEPEELERFQEHVKDGSDFYRDGRLEEAIGEFEAARVIYALVLLGLVEVDRPIDEIGAALDDALTYQPPQ